MLGQDDSRNAWLDGTFGERRDGGDLLAKQLRV
jgi:hypothetical protein